MKVGDIVRVFQGPYLGAAGPITVIHADGLTCDIQGSNITTYKGVNLSDCVLDG